MNHSHYTPFTLSLDIDESSPELGDVLYRKIARCDVCRAALQDLSQWLGALDHCDPLVGPEFVTRHEFFNQLLAQNPSHEERIAALRTDELFHQWGLYRLLLEESRSCRSTNPELSAQLAELALEVSSHLDEAFYRPERVADARAQAAANHGDALRKLKQLEEATRKFEAAREWLESGTGRTGIASSLARLEARLLRDMGRADEAHELLEQAIVAHEEREAQERNLLHWILEPCSQRSEDGMLQS